MSQQQVCSLLEDKLQGFIKNETGHTPGASLSDLFDRWRKEYIGNGDTSEIVAEILANQQATGDFVQTAKAYCDARPSVNFAPSSSHVASFIEDYVGSLMWLTVDETTVTKLDITSDLTEFYHCVSQMVRMLQMLDSHDPLQAPLHALWFFLRRSRFFTFDKFSNLTLENGVTLSRRQFMQSGANTILPTGQTLLQHMAVCLCTPAASAGDSVRTLQAIDAILAVSILVEVYGADPAALSTTSWGSGTPQHVSASACPTALHYLLDHSSLAIRKPPAPRGCQEIATMVLLYLVNGRRLGQELLNASRMKSGREVSLRHELRECQRHEAVTKMGQKELVHAKTPGASAFGSSSKKFATRSANGKGKSMKSMDDARSYSISSGSSSMNSSMNSSSSSSYMAGVDESMQDRAGGSLRDMLQIDLQVLNPSLVTCTHTVLTIHCTHYTAGAESVPRDGVRRTGR
jgi:hypothetical protein